MNADAATLELRAQPSPRLSPGAGVGLAGLGTVATALTAWSGWSSPILTNTAATAVSRASIVAVYTATGLYCWWRARPTERFAVVMVALGLTYALTDLIGSGDPALHSLGRVLNAAWVGLFVYAFLSFPSGRLEGRVERLLVAGYAAGSLLLWPVLVLIAAKLPSGGSLTGCVPNCPRNGLRAWEMSSRAAKAPTFLILVLTSVVLVATALQLLRKARSPVGVERNTVAPVLLAGVLVVLTYVGFSIRPMGGTLHTAAAFLGAAAALSAPIAFLIGPLRGELYVSRSLWRGLSGFDYLHFSPIEVESLCRRALGDGTLRLAEYGSSTDADGGLGDPEKTIARSEVAPAVTILAGRVHRYAVVHDRRLGRGYYSSLVERVGALAVTLIEYAGSLREVVVSRQRIAKAESDERRRLERDLHDGAQQHLLALQLQLDLLRDRVSGSALESRVEELSRAASEATEEVRRIAHGIYPTTLAERGAASAIRRMPMPPAIRLEVEDRGVGRLPRGDERALYFAVQEAIQNASKHSGGNRVDVVLERVAETIEVTVADNGHGFDPTAGDGAGLTHMRDRIESIGGNLQISSSPRQGTLVRFVVPANDPDDTGAT